MTISESNYICSDTMGNPCHCPAAFSVLLLFENHSIYQTKIIIVFSICCSVYSICQDFVCQMEAGPRDTSLHDGSLTLAHVSINGLQTHTSQFLSSPWQPAQDKAGGNGATSLSKGRNKTIKPLKLGEFMSGLEAQGSVTRTLRF